VTVPLADWPPATALTEIVYVPLVVPIDEGGLVAGGVVTGCVGFVAGDTDPPQEAKKTKIPANTIPRASSRDRVLNNINPKVMNDNSIMVVRVIAIFMWEGVAKADDCAVVVTIRDVPSFVHVP
jgi:hypothetical protein